MDNTQKLRIRTAMIIYELELSLGNYVLQNEVLENISEIGKSSIIEREKGKGNEINRDDINLIIEASYLDEIFNFAINTTEGTHYHTHMKDLKSLCALLGIFNIRNAVSHPNRPFPDSYWFRTATIASDPLIEKLGLNSIRNALNSAVEGNINTPPDEWLYDVNWAIPNTLPRTFDHEITGLLGREKEFKDLENVLSKERNNLIAIVAPGGIGKTALVLQYLKDLSLSPNWTNRLSSIIFCTLKNERLTANGIESIEAINGIDQIKNTILQDLKKIYNRPALNSIEDAYIDLKDEKILICIDNLETLLMDSQKEFIEFNESLPLYWRVLVTSRISLDSATTVPLEPLVKRHAVNLSRNYLRKRGIVDFKQEDLEKIADSANNNPLAIRLTIDLYIKGVNISQSIHKSQKDIASFSYKNLIESLRESSIAILEAIYVIGNSSKSELIEFLELSNEDITQSINELSKTSLLVRSTDEFGKDSFKLSESIRDLLLTNPKNIEVRNKIAEDLRKRKTKILEQNVRSKQLGLSAFDEEFIDDNTEPLIHSLIVDLNKYFSKSQNKDHGELITLKNKFYDLIAYKANDSQLLFHYSRILRELKDSINELSYLKKAEELLPSPRIKLAIALRYFYNNDYEDSLSYFEELTAKQFNLPTTSTKKFSYTVTKLQLICLLYLRKFDDILLITNNWEEQEHWKVLHGVHRATALKRSIEYQYHSVELTEKVITESLNILDKIFKEDGYQDFACSEATKVLRESFITSKKLSYSYDFKLHYATFISNHFFNIISTLKNEHINSNENRKFLERIYDLDLNPNPLHNVKWYQSNEEQTVYDNEHIDELLADGYRIVSVYHIPEDKGYGMSSFLFAEDNNKNQFYLSVNNFDEGWNRWGYIKENKKLAIKYTSLNTNGKPTPAKEIVEIDSY